MPKDFNLNDFDEARRNPRQYMPTLIKTIRKGERGYHAVLRDRVAWLLAMTYAALESFELFAEWRQADCFEGDTKLLSLTEENFQQQAARCVVTLGCSDSDILSSTRSKCLTVIKDFIGMEVEPEECADFIKAQGGFEVVYQAAKEKRAHKKARSTGASRLSKSDARSSTDTKKVRAGSAVQAGRAKRSSEGASVQGEAEDPHGSQLWIDLDDDELDDFRIHAENDEIRLLKVRCGGKRGPTSPMIWSLLEYEIVEHEA